MRLIDGEELKTALDGYLHHITLIKKRSRKTEEAILADVKGIIDSAPTIEERKKGKWIKRDVSLFRCSECGRFHPAQENYCPNCGAEMKGERNAEVE